MAAAGHKTGAGVKEPAINGRQLTYIPNRIVFVLALPQVMRIASVLPAYNQSEFT